MARRLGCTQVASVGANVEDKNGNDEGGDGEGDDDESKNSDDSSVEKDYKPRMRLFDAIVPILKATTGRVDAPQLATQLLRELSKAKETRMGFACIQERLVELASNEDQRVSYLVWNHVWNPHVDTAAQEDDEDDELEQSASASGDLEGSQSEAD